MCLSVKTHIQNPSEGLIEILLPPLSAASEAKLVTLTCGLS